jgi:tetratricopeptide (TPR) repeat protein
MEALSDEEDEHSYDKSTSDHSELVCLLYHFLVNESIVREWCYDIPLNFFTPDKAVTIATLIGAWTRGCSGPFLDGLKLWLENCTARPAKVFMPVARANAVGCLQGDWVTLPSLLVVVRIKALHDREAILDEEQGHEPSDILIKAARWFRPEESAH